MITIENGTVIYGEDMEAIKANIMIDDGIITEINRDGASSGKKIDARGCIIAPTFINSHVHTGDSIARDIGDGKHINEIVKPPHGLKHKILSESPSEEIVAEMRQSMRNMLASGTTTFVDFREGGLQGIELMNEASEDIPIRKIILGRDDSFYGDETEKSEIKKAARNIIKSCDGIGLSGFGEIRDEVAGLITKTCKKHGKISAIHVAEYEKLQRESVEVTGKSEVARAVEANFDILVHVTSPVMNDLEIINKSKCSVVCCPRSNGSLSVGIPPVMDLIKHKINVLLGTDNIMFNSPNMLRELEYTLKATRGYYREHFSSVELLKMATLNASKTFNLNTGCIKEDRKADLMIVKKNSENPILSIVNRTELKDFKYLIKDDIILSKSSLGS